MAKKNKTENTKKTGKTGMGKLYCTVPLFI